MKIIAIVLIMILITAMMVIMISFYIISFEIEMIFLVRILKSIK